MAAARELTAPGANGPVTWLRIGLVAALVLVWEGVAASGIFYRDVVPSLTIIARSLVDLFTDGQRNFYWHLGVTAYEVLVALAIGSAAGLAAGIALGASRYLSRAFEPYLYYLGPTPKIVFFPVILAWFGIGSGSKIAIGAITCFFPVALSVAGGMREIAPVLIQVGQSFRASTWQMVMKIYLPAMRAPIVNGLRLGLGVVIIVVLLAETKFANRGIGYLVIQSYFHFDMPQMYALLIVLFVLAIGGNALMGRLGGADPRTVG
jgi:NitT/TauT family transport system permease protein